MQHYIYGAGGHGKVVLDAMKTAHIDCAGFIDDKDISSWMGLGVYPIAGLTLEAEVYLHIAIGNNRVREAIVKSFLKAKFFSVTHPAATIAQSAKIGSGTLVAAQSVLAPDVHIGNHCIINHSAVVDHDCTVGDYTHIAPQSCLGGGVKVGKGVLIGTGAVVLPGVEIADYAVVGAGAIVTKNIGAEITVVGNPAKRMN